MAAAGSLTTGGGASAGANSVLIFDGSNSMNSPFDGGSRLEALKSSIGQTVPHFADRLDLGLVVFGHREAQSCVDIETMVPPGPEAASQLPATVQGITAQGVSTLAVTLTRAAEEAGYRERSATIIAVADNAGVENCGVDTCETAAALAADAADLRIHVIAISANEDEVPTLSCIASATGGAFYNAASRSALTAALNHTFEFAVAHGEAPVELAIDPPRSKPAPRVALAEVPPRPKPAGVAAGEPPEDGPESEEVAQTRGRDDGEAENPPDEVADAAPPEENVSVFSPTRPASGETPPESEGDSTSADEPARAIVIGPDAGEPETDQAPNTSTFEPSRPQGTEEAGASALSAERLAEMRRLAADAVPRRVDAGRADDSLAVSPSLEAAPASTVLARRPDADDDSAGEAEAPSAAGAQMEAEATAPAPAPGPTEAPQSGRVRLAAYIVADTNPIPSDVAWQVMEAGNGDGERDVVAESSDTTPELELPVGDYFVRATFGSATRTAPVRVDADETAQVDLVLNAGGLQIDPVNAGTEEPADDVLNTIYAAGTTRRPVAEDVPSGSVVYLNAGVYRVESRYGNANAVALADIEVQPGKLVKAKINHRAGPAEFRLVSEGSDEPLTGATWQVLASDGTVVTESSDPTPRYVFAEGAYDLVVVHAGKTYRSSFEIKPGQETSVEVVAR